MSHEGLTYYLRSLSQIQAHHELYTTYYALEESQRATSQDQRYTYHVVDRGSFAQGICQKSSRPGPSKISEIGFIISPKCGTIYPFKEDML